MIPIKNHIEKLQRFENKINEVNNRIEEITKADPNGNSENNNELLNLYRKYRQLIKLWSKIDDFIEFKVQTALEE